MNDMVSGFGFMRLQTEMVTGDYIEMVLHLPLSLIYKWITRYPDIKAE